MNPVTYAFFDSFDGIVVALGVAHSAHSGIRYCCMAPWSTLKCIRAGTLVGPLAAVLLAACVPFASGDAAGTGSRHTVRLELPPLEAAHCFARNAEDRSSALVSEVRADGDGGARTIVRVKNGVTYATAQFQRAGKGATGEIQLMVTSTERRGDLVKVLVKGC